MEDNKNIVVTIITDSGKGTDKTQTTVKQKVKKCITTDRPHREGVTTVRPTGNEHTATTAKPHKEMGNPCEELQKGWYILQVTRPWMTGSEAAGGSGSRELDGLGDARTRD